MRKILLFAGLIPMAWAVACGSSPGPAAGTPPATAPPTLAPVAMQFHRQGGIAGLCDDVTVRADGLLEYHTCGQPLQTATLTAAERAELAGWVRDLSRFSFKQEDNPGGPDNLVREIQFAGRGSTRASDQLQLEMLSWIEAIYSELARQPQPGSTASTAGRVLDVMNGQVIVIRPDEPGHDLIVVTPETLFTTTAGDTASLADVLPGAHVTAEGIALGAGGLQADTVVIGPAGE